ncbi:LPP20 family lipoprotein [Marinobacter mangrovi]|uniref:LPP20 family lipoprotein n=1 Tax=Marinobacter mangrovi TaxID=2803918 RepID=UPI001932CCC6|nr:hypothetical protein [Marinobacter mangrovi]
MMNPNGVMPLVLEAEGYAPINTQPGPSYEEKLMQAMEASRMDAYRHLAEQIYGQQVRLRSDVEDDAVSDKRMDAKVDGLVRGAVEVTHGIDGKFYTTKLSLDTSTLPELQGISQGTTGAVRHKWWY